MTISRAVIALLLAVPATLFAAVELSPVRSTVDATGAALSFAGSGDGFLAVVKTPDLPPKGIALQRDGQIAASPQVFSGTTPSVARFHDHYVVSEDDATSVRLTEVAADGTRLRVISRVNVSDLRLLRSTTSGSHLALVPEARRHAMLLLDGTAAREVTFRDPTFYGGSDDDEFFFYSIFQTLDLHRVRGDASAPAQSISLGRATEGNTSAAAASNGSDVLVVRSAAPGSVLPEAIRITAGGAVESKSIQAFANRPILPVSLLWTGKEYVLIALQTKPFNNADAAVAMRFSADGSPIGDPVTLLQGEYISFAGAAWNAERVVAGVTATTVALTDRVRQAFSIAFAPEDMAHPRIDVLSTTSAPQIEPQVASSGQAALVVWQEPGARSGSLKGALLRSDGRASSQDISVAGITTSYKQQHRVAYGNGSFVVVWQDLGAIFARRISGTGDLIDAQPIVVATTTGTDAIAVASDGTRFVVLWADTAALLHSAIIDGGSVTATHTFPSMGFPSEIDVAHDGIRYLAAWVRPAYGCAITCTPPPNAIDAVFLDASGAPMTREITFPSDAFDLHVASRPGNFLVSYRGVATHIATFTAVSGGPAPAFGTPFRGPLLQSLSKPSWTGTSFVAGATIANDIVLMQVAGNGAPLSSRTLKTSAAPGAAVLAPLATAPDFLIVQQPSVIATEPSVPRLMLFHESEFMPGRVRAVGR